MSNEARGARQRAADHARFQVPLTTSPLYAGLLVHIGDDIEAGGPCWQALSGHEDEPIESALALRLLGAVHRLVLAGDAPQLALHYPSAGGEAAAGDPWPAFERTVDAHVPEIRPLLERTVQTNEVSRSAALVPGFHAVARRWRLPLRVLEIGTSVGLNLRWDHFYYAHGDAHWGDATSAVQFTDVFDVAPEFEAGTTVASRAGCDRNPIDASSDDGRLTLESYLWPDQLERFRMLEAALEVAGRVSVAIERADALQWAERQLAVPTPGMATVLFHSIFIQYLTPDERGRLRDVIHEAGARATADAPVCWLRMEPGGPQAKVELRQWPGGDRTTVAHAGYHGRPVQVGP